MKTLKTATLAAAALAMLAVTAVPAEAHRRIPRHSHHWSMRVGPPRVVNHVVIIDGKPASIIDFNVKPKTTKIYVDGTYRGTCDDFDGFPRKMYLKPGYHRIKLVTPDGREITERVELAAGFEINFNLEMH